MAVVIDTLMKEPKAERVVLAETRENEYDVAQTRMLREIANAYNKILNEDKLLSLHKLGPAGCEDLLPRRLAELQFLVLELLRKDPIGAYVRLKHMINKAKLAMTKSERKECYAHYLANCLMPMEAVLSDCTLIKTVKPVLHKFKPGDRSLYRELFHPIVRPNFMLTRYMSMPPKTGRLVEKYRIGNVLVEIFSVPGKVRFIYHITPPEFRLSEEKYAILDAARRYLAERRPTERELTEAESARETFLHIGRDLIKDLARSMHVSLRAEEVEELATILARYTAGFGVLELLLADERIQDVYINSPIGLTPIYVYHADYEECETNLIPTREDAEAWATRFRLYSGRPLDEANPVLDTELLVPGGRARVAAITRTLSPEGLAFALRRHRDRPWTFPLFMDVRFFDPLYAGLMSFIIDGGRALLVAGGRSAGKTSVLGAMMLEIMRKFRLVVQEDSVTGDCNIVVKRNGKFERTTIGKLIDRLMDKYGCQVVEGREILNENPENIEVFAINSDNKVILNPVKSFIRHKVEKDIFEIETRTGKVIRVTGDHSLFTMGDDGKIVEAKVSELKIGSHIVTPRILPIRNATVESINVLNHLDELKDGFISGSSISRFIEENKELIKKVAMKCGYACGKHGYPKGAIYYWKKHSVIPSRVFGELLRLGCKIDAKGLKFRINASRPLPVEIKLDEDFLTFIGLWLADGCYDKWNVLVSVVKDETRNVVYRICKRFNINVRMHRDGFSLVLPSKTLKTLMRDILKLKGNAYTKTMPNWVYELSTEQIASVLKGIFSGDGYLTKNEVAISLTSLSLIKEIQTLLLSFGIVARRNKINKKDETYSLRISSQKSLRPFFDNIGFLQKKWMRRLNLICRSISTHDTTDIVPLSVGFKKGLSSLLPPFIFNRHDYVKRRNHIGREKLKDILKKVGCKDSVEALQRIENLAYSDIFWDEVRSIKCVGKTDEYVYDLSVPPCENFICENILAHNTLELPVVQMRKLGYNIERLKSRSVITRVETELPADEALRTALRLGDSVLIIGEIRSVEGKALFEAMRIGALANVVAGTIHGESAYGVYDRVVNDLGVPPTSFKAIDLITICNMLRSPDGLHRFRRVTALTEVRKHWREDPAAEGGFVNLMEYSAKEDKLKPTDTLTDGESEVLNEIAKRVREWHGRWDVMWDNIQLRAKIKQTMLEYAKKLKRPETLEADWTVESNEMFHLISNRVMEEVGGLDSKMIYKEWLEWFKNKLKSK